MIGLEIKPKKQSSGSSTNHPDWVRTSGGSQSGKDGDDTIITSCDYAVEIVNHRINQILKHLIDQGATDGDVISRARNFIERLTHALRKRTSYRVLIYIFKKSLNFPDSLNRSILY